MFVPLVNEKIGYLLADNAWWLEVDGEGWTQPERTFNSYISAHLLNKLLADGQPEAYAVSVHAHVFIKFVEIHKKLGHTLLGHATSKIFDDDIVVDVVRAVIIKQQTFEFTLGGALLMSFNFNYLVYSQLHDNFASFIRKLQCVGQEINHDLKDAAWITKYLFRKFSFFGNNLIL
jgi:hypothetical protein